MSSRCSVCQHEEVLAIERGLVVGKPLRILAEQYGLSKSALDRHRQKHLADKLAKHSKKEDGQAEKLVALTFNIASRLKGLLDKAEAGNNIGQAISAAREMLHAVNQVAQLQGHIDTAAQINILSINAPEIKDLQARIMEALLPFPQARQAVAKALAPGATDDDVVDAEYEDAD